MQRSTPTFHGSYVAGTAAKCKTRVRTGRGVRRRSFSWSCRTLGISGDLAEVFEELVSNAGVGFVSTDLGFDVCFSLFSSAGEGGGGWHPKLPPVLLHLFLWCCKGRLFSRFKAFTCWQVQVLCHFLTALPVMDDDLVKLLSAPKPKGWALNEEVVAVILKNGITSVPMFSKCVDSEKELKPAFITPTAQANSMAESSKLKLAWEAACLLTEKVLKRGPETDLDSLHDLDTPLAPAIQEDLEDRFTKVYSWNGFPSAMVGCDSLLGRVNREFLVAKPSMFRIA